MVPVEFGVSSSLLSNANGGIGASNVLPSDRSNRNFPLENIQKDNKLFRSFRSLSICPKPEIGTFKVLRPNIRVQFTLVGKLIGQPFGDKKRF